MIANKYRFHGHGSLKFLFKNGASTRDKLFGLKYIVNPKRQHPRIAVIVSKKIYKSAVKRNRIRRRIFEVIRVYWLAHNHNTNLDIAITVLSPGVLDIPHAELLTSLSNLFKELPNPTASR